MNLLDYPKELKVIDYHAHRIYYNLNRSSRVHLDIQDLIQAGYIALWGATKNYKPVNGCTFTSYANIRIHGDMIDTIRKFCPIDFRSNRPNTYKKNVTFTEFDLQKPGHVKSIEINTDEMDSAKVATKIKKRLDPKKKRIFSKYLLDMDQKKIADSENLTASAISICIKKIINRARLDYEQV